MSTHTHAHLGHANARFVKAIAVSLTLLASLAAQAQPQENSQDHSNKPYTQQTAALSRAEVIADLVLWRRAGVDQHQVAYSHHLETEGYHKAYQEYLRLRHSEAYQIEVQKALQE